MPRIVQILPTVVYGDAVSNHALALADILKQMNLETEIYAQNIGRGAQGKVKHMDRYRNSGKDILIYHMSTGTSLSQDVMKMPSFRKVMIYHNITPPEFMRDYSWRDYRILREGRRQLAMMKDTFDWAFGDSEYNCRELSQYGYRNVHLLPILISYPDYGKVPSRRILTKYQDGRTNILFLGRIAPNKRQEDIIKTFFYYRNYMDPTSRLFLVGSYTGMERYYGALQLLTEKLELADVFFTGKVPFEEILAYYRISDVFLCMSEHEGFCVPLIESMLFQVPILAYSSTAIPDTLGNAGVLLKEKDYGIAAELLNRIVHDQVLRDKLIANEAKRLEHFSYERVAGCVREYIKEILGEENEQK